jgi:hypothetical protein
MSNQEYLYALLGGKFLGSLSSPTTADYNNYNPCSSRYDSLLSILYMDIQYSREEQVEGSFAP